MTPKDLEELYEIYNDPDVILGLSGFNIVPRAANFKDLIKTWSETNPLFVVAVDTETGELIGQTSLRFEAPSQLRDGELAVVVKKSQWGKGYGTEVVAWIVQHAFKYMDFHRVSLRAFSSNERAIAVYKKVFVFNVLRNDTRSDGMQGLRAGRCHA